MDNAKLKQWMAENEIGNNELARHLDVSPALVSRYASGERPVSASFKWRFLNKFGMNSTVSAFEETRRPDPISTAK